MRTVGQGNDGQGNETSAGLGHASAAADCLVPHCLAQHSLPPAPPAPLPNASPLVVIHISGRRQPICRCNPAGLSRGSFGFPLRQGRDSLPQSRGLVPRIVRFPVTSGPRFPSPIPRACPADRSASRYGGPRLPSPIPRACPADLRLPATAGPRFPSPPGSLGFSARWAAPG